VGYIPTFFKGVDFMDYKLMRMLEQIITRQNALIDMLSSFIEVYAKDNNHAIEGIEEECEYIDFKDIDR
jgi:hypothetical protein